MRLSTYSIQTRKEVPNDAEMVDFFIHTGTIQIFETRVRITQYSNFSTISPNTLLTGKVVAYIVI